MATTTTKILNSNFGGIRRKDSIFSADKITCSDCQNVELFYTELNSGVGIRTAKGNSNVTTYRDAESLKSLIPSNEYIIAMFESSQDGNTVTFLYTESEASGRLYSYARLTNTLTLIKDGLKCTGMASATDFTQGWLDMFVFSNGEDFVYVYSNTELHDGLHVEEASNLHLKDVENRNVKGLGLIVWDSRLWVFNGKVLWYSEQAECRNFEYNDASITTSAGYIEFVKPITAIYPYLGSLAVFHKDSSVLLKLDSTTSFSQDEESPGGCASYNSLVFHGTDLYFYDDTKKGVFSFQQIVNGDKTLGENIALDIQDELIKIDAKDVDKIRALSVVTSDRNEVWFLVPISDDDEHSIVMIYDYIRGEWVKRKCQKIYSIGILKNKIYSGGKELYEEYTSDLFDGQFIGCYYCCTAFNLGEDNSLKITKFPPRATVDAYYTNHFWCKYVKNYAYNKEPKIKEIKAKTLKNILSYDSDMAYDSVYRYKIDNVNSIIKLPSATFKTLEMTLYTQAPDEQFAIKSLEFSKIKVKQV